MIFLLIIFVISCDCGKEDLIYYNQSLETVYALAKRHERNYCVVLLDSTQNLSKQYEKRLKQNLSSDNAIYNIVDVNIPENMWYIKWLCPLSLPLTCVFTFDGTLIDIIPGSNKESLLYTKDALSKGVRTKFHFVNRFNVKKENIIPLYNQILKCHVDLEYGVYTEIDESIVDSLNYPYPYYLSVLGNLINYDTIGAQKIAKKMIQLENPYYLDSYRNEFIVAKKIINPEFDINNEPNIRINKDIITICNHKVGEVVPFEITIYNDGEEVLKISKIYKSCTCIELETSEEFDVQPKDSTKVLFKFLAEEKGDVFREIFIISNAINSPISYIKILANLLE